MRQSLIGPANIFFGSSQQSYIPAHYRGQFLLEQEPFASIAKQLGLDQLIFLHQTHGTDGVVIKKSDTDNSLLSFVIEGDYLLTDVPGIGLGVSTADCLSVILIDKKGRCVGAIHAGWRGARSGILEKVIDRAQQEFGSHPEDLEFHFGPSAHVCCYEVSPPFIEEFASYPFAKEAFRKEGDRLFFDLPKFAALQLASLGVQKIVPSEACTICMPGYCSVRRVPNSPLRQMTVVAKSDTFKGP